MNESLGFYGEQRRRYLRTHHNGIYTGMLLSGTLWPHLQEINTQAEQMEERLIAQMKTAESVTESLKASDQMEWVRRMNNIRQRAKETVLNELIYT